MNSELFDGLDSTKFLRSDASDTTTGDLTISKQNPTLTLINPVDTSGNNPKIVFDHATTSSDQSVQLECEILDGNLPVAGYGLVVGPTSTNSQFPSVGTLTFNVLGDIYAGNTTLGSLYRVLTTNDEGSGNGLDADTLDSLHASSFLRSNADDTATGKLTITNTSTIGGVTWANGWLKIGDGSVGWSIDANEIFQSNTTGYIGSLATNGELHFRFPNNGIFIVETNGGAETFRINSSGNVGIGTTSPSEKLDVNGTIVSRSTQAFAISDGTQYFDIIRRTAYTNAGTGFGITIGAQQGLVIGSGESVTEVSSNVDLTNTEVLYITSDPTSTSDAIKIITSLQSGWASRVDAITIQGRGYVGILNSSPSSPLHVNGIITAQTGSSIVYIGADPSLASIELQGGGAYIDFKDAVEDYDIRLQRAGDAYFRILTSGADEVFTLKSGDVGIGITSPSYKLHVNGSFAATTKSFVIDHPTKPNHKLRYGSLESPYHGIRLTGRGKTKNKISKIKLPEYISSLVFEESINIQLTCYKSKSKIWVSDIKLYDNSFFVEVESEDCEFFWDFTATRKDVD